MKTTTLKLTLCIATLLAISIFYACQKKDSGTVNDGDEKNSVSSNIIIEDNNLPKCEVDDRNHQISYEQGKDYIDRYQRAIRNRALGSWLLEKDGWTIAETFSKESIDKMAGEQYFCKFRSYYGLDRLQVLHVILVGANSLGRDIFYANTHPALNPEDLMVPQLILDNSVICRPYCDGVYITPTP
jgi:hypothetical protein